MGKFTRDLIEYDGVDTCSYEDISTFKQFNSDYKFMLPIEKPDIEQLIKVKAKATIEHHEVIKTPIGTSLEGQRVTGFKLLVAGDINIKYEYIASDPTQSIYSVSRNFPFCDYVVLPEDFNMSTMIFPAVSLEDIFSEQLDNRSVYNNLTIIVVVEVY